MKTKIKTSLRARGVPWCFGGPTQLAYSAYREDRLWGKSRAEWNPASSGGSFCFSH